MREVSLPDRELVAADVRGRWFAAVAPLVASTVEAADAQLRGLLEGRTELHHNKTGELFRVRPVVLVQFHPLLARVLAVGMPYAVELSRWGRAMLPDADALESVMEDVLGGALSNVPSEDADALLILEASTRAGGLAVWGDPSTGQLKMIGATPGQDLGEALVFGAIESAPETAH